MHKMPLDILEKADPDVFRLAQEEKKRQMEGLELIPSENLVSQPILEAMATVFTNKYSEGYPGKRYYGGNEVVDQLENLAIARAQKLFGAEHVNVQPLSGSPANMAALTAFLAPGDPFMGLKLTEGGHLTHGHPVNFSGKFFKPVQYGVEKETEMLDYDAILRQAREVKPKLILSGFTAYPREIDFRQFRDICDEVGAIAMADIAHIAALCCTGQHQNPVPFFDVVTTTTHKTLRGPRGAMILCRKEHAEKVDKAVFPGMQGGPHEHLIAAKALCFKEAMQPSFTEYAKQVVKNARALGDSLLDHGFRLVSGGTDTHLLLVDVFKKGVTGKQAESALEKAGIYCNKNTIPFDTRTPWDPSGIRIGTPTLTTRGMKEGEMKEVGSLISEVLAAHENESVHKKVRGKVRELCKEFPFYA